MSKERKKYKRTKCNLWRTVQSSMLFFHWFRLGKAILGHTFLNSRIHTCPWVSWVKSLIPWHPNNDQTKSWILIRLMTWPSQQFGYLPASLTTSRAIHFRPLSRHQSRVKLDELKWFRLLCATSWNRQTLRHRALGIGSHNFLSRLPLQSGMLQGRYFCGPLWQKSRLRVPATTISHIRPCLQNKTHAALGPGPLLAPR